MVVGWLVGEKVRARVKCLKNSNITPTIAFSTCIVIGEEIEMQSTLTNGVLFQSSQVHTIHTEQHSRSQLSQEREVGGGRRGGEGVSERVVGGREKESLSDR